MSNVNTDGLPPEMQARIAQIIEGAKAKAVAAHQPQHLPASPHQAALAQPAAPVAPPAPLAPPTPNLMDHTIALRQEVAALSQQMAAMGQVVEACGQAVGSLYSMFQQQTTPTDSGATYRQNFQEQVDVGED